MRSPRTGHGVLEDDVVVFRQRKVVQEGEAGQGEGLAAHHVEACAWAGRSMGAPFSRDKKRCCNGKAWRNLLLCPSPAFLPHCRQAHHKASPTPQGAPSSSSKNVSSVPSQGGSGCKRGPTLQRRAGTGGLTIEAGASAAYICTWLLHLLHLFLHHTFLPLALRPRTCKRRSRGARCLGRRGGAP